LARALYMTTLNYDLVVIGGGSGGLTAARVAAELGVRTGAGGTAAPGRRLFMDRLRALSARLYPFE
jgi:glycine/D-amino acid oxidase-like deaminating enzyme